MKQLSSFKCSDPMLERIWETGVNTLSIRMQDRHEDTRHRQHLEDARVQALINYYVFGDTELAAKALRQFVRNPHANYGLPDCDLVWVMMLKDYSDYTASSSILEDLHSNLKRLMDDRYSSQEDENGLLVSELTSDNMFYYKALVDASELAARARDFKSAEAWRERAKRVRKAINERFWDDRKGVYADCTVGNELSDTINEQANYLAILFDIADEHQTKRILEYLDSDQPKVTSVEPYFNFYLLEALAKAGRYQQALDMIRREWGEMSERGVSVLMSTPMYWLMKHVAGIQLPDATARIPYRIQPQLCDLQWVKAKLDGIKVDVR